MQEIKAWLQGGSYAAGTKLYQRYGNNSFLKKQFAGNQNKFLENKLREELVKLSNGIDSTLRETVKPETKVLITPNSGELKSSHIKQPTPAAQPPRTDLQRKYLELQKKRDRLYKELSFHMAEKFTLPEGFLLKDCCKQILTKHRMITEIWVLLDHYQVHQTFPDEPVKPAKPEIDPEKEIQLLRSAISKANKRLASANCRNKKKTEETLQISKTRLDELVANRKVS